jgi:hypothetical protein
VQWLQFAECLCKLQAACDWILILSAPCRIKFCVLDYRHRSVGTVSGVICIAERDSINHTRILHLLVWQAERLINEQLESYETDKLSPRYRKGMGSHEDPPCFDVLLLDWNTTLSMHLGTRYLLENTPSVSKQKLRFTKSVRLRSFFVFLAQNCVRCIALTKRFPVS